MPILYEYFGLLFMFYSNEPVHVHVRYREYENAYELIINDGVLIALRKRKIRGKKELTVIKAKQAEKLIVAYLDKILQKWFEFFVLNKEVTIEKIA